MIVWGWKTRWTTLWAGTFGCPYERQYRHGRLRQARRWFHLYWIPTVPRQILGQVVTCDSCGREFDERVLQMVPVTTAAQTATPQAPASPQGSWPAHQHVA